MRKLLPVLAPVTALLGASAVLMLCGDRITWFIAGAGAWLVGITVSFLLRSAAKNKRFGGVRAFLFDWVYDGFANVPSYLFMLLPLAPIFKLMPWVAYAAAAFCCALGTVFLPPLLTGPLEKLKRVLNEEAVGYLVFGVLTTVVNIIAFAVLCDVLHITELIANVIAWAVSVAFAYVTNRFFVFDSRANGFCAILREMGLFIAARLLSLGIDEAGMYICLYLLQWNKMTAKVLMNILVIIFNYFASKLIIFRNKKEGFDR